MLVWMGVGAYCRFSAYCGTTPTSNRIIDGWLVVLSLAAFLDSISVYIGPSPREREKEERKDRRE